MESEAECDDKPEASTSAELDSEFIECSTLPGMPTEVFFVEDDAPYMVRHLKTEEILKMWNLARVVKNLGTNEQCVAFAEENGLVHTERKCNKRHMMRVSKSTNNSFGSWVCSKGECRYKSKRARTIGTVFENIKIKLVYVFYLIYAYAHKWNYNMAIHEDPYREDRGQCLSRSTISDWYSNCRECVVAYQLDKNEYTGKIGGPSKTVQIDKMKFGLQNQKNNVAGRWIIGMIEDGSEDLRLEVCPENEDISEVLLSIIEKHVEKGTTIHTDEWEAYDCLAQNGFIHKKVNHSEYENRFVAPDGTHTQRIVSQWKGVKRFFQKDNYNNRENVADVVVEYMWRRHTVRLKRDPFMETIKAIRFVYKIK